MTDRPDEAKIVPIEELLAEPQRRAGAGEAPADDPDAPEPMPPSLWERIGDVHPGFTYGILLLTLIVFALQLVTARVRAAEVFSTGGSLVGPLVDTGALTLAATRGGEAWRLLSSLLLHANLVHIGANLIALVILGGVAERAFGHGRFLVIYIGSGLAGSAASLWNQQRLVDLVAAGSTVQASAGSIGASGAIFGVGAAVVVAAFRMRGLLPPWRARALVGAVLPMLLASLAGGFARPGTDSAAHLGGAAAGILLGLVLPLHPRLTGRVEPAWARLGWAAVGLIGFGALVASGVVAWRQAFPGVG